MKDYNDYVKVEASKKSENSEEYLKNHIGTGLTSIGQSERLVFLSKSKGP